MHSSDFHVSTLIHPNMQLEENNYFTTLTHLFITRKHSNKQCSNNSLQHVIPMPYLIIFLSLFLSVLGTTWEMVNKYRQKNPKYSI